MAGAVSGHARGVPVVSTRAADTVRRALRRGELFRQPHSGDCHELPGAAAQGIRAHRVVGLHRRAVAVPRLSSLPGAGSHAIDGGHAGRGEQHADGGDHAVTVADRPRFRGPRVRPAAGRTDERRLDRSVGRVSRKARGRIPPGMPGHGHRVPAADASLRRRSKARRVRFRRRPISTLRPCRWR